MLAGAYTAIVTPFKSDESVDYAKLEELIGFQIDNGIDGIVPVGTTGESPTLSFEEHKKVIETAISVCKGKATVIAGTGGNSTAEAVELTRHAKEAGADATLQVTPYYNKPSQEGLYRHFSAVADIGLPVVLYNIPGRTGREIALDTVARLSEHPNVVAVKEAGGQAVRVSETLARCDICVVSGDDSLTLPMMSLGGKGVISVATNVEPRGVSDMVHSALDGNFQKAMELHRKYFGLFTNLFLDTNPIPVKAALAMMGKIEEVYRLPLCPMKDELKQKLRKCLEELGLVS